MGDLDESELKTECEVCGHDIPVDETWDCEGCGVVVCSSCMEGDICIDCYDEQEEEVRRGG